MVKMARDWKTKTVTVHAEDWADTEVVVLKAYYGDRDRQRVLSASTQYHREEDGSMSIVATLDKLTAIKRELAVMSWTLLYDDGTPIPFNRETLLNLPPEVAEYIDAKVNELWDVGQPMTQEDAEAEEAKN